MPEEFASEEGVNQEPVADEAQAQASDSPADVGQADPAQPPAEEHSAQGDKPEVSEAVPYPRFKEVNDKAKSAEQRALEADRRAKELEARLAKLESGSQERQSAEQSQQRFSKAVSKLSALGVDQEAAKKLAEVVSELAGEEVDSRVRPLAQATAQQEITGWTREFARTHPDYEEMAPAMGEAYASLPQIMQDLISIDPKGLDLMYAYAKLPKMQEELGKARQEGAQEAYQNRRMKGAVSSTVGAGSSQPKAMTEKDIADMSVKDYMALKSDPKRWAEAMSQLARAQGSED